MHGTKRPRVVVCVDLDCFYAQVLERLHPELRGKPLAVRQKYITVTCNYEARKFGITKLMALDEAQKVCPALKIVDGSDLRPFREASEAIGEVLQSYGCPVERKGMDESFIDISDLVDMRMPSMATYGAEFTGHVLGDSSTIDEDLKRRLVQGSLIAQEMRDALVRQLGFKTCAGIGICKTSAKLAAELHKPNQQSTIIPSALYDYMTNLEVTKVQGFGRAMVRDVFRALTEQSDESLKEFENPYNLKCAHVRQLSLAVLTRALASNSGLAQFVYHVVRGTDERPVKASTLLKTISQEETSLPHPDTWDSANDRLRTLCERIMEFVRARRKKHGHVAHTLRVSISDKADAVETRNSQSFSNRSDHEAYRRRNRRHASKQCKVDAAVFRDAETLHRCAQTLLRGCLPSSVSTSPSSASGATSTPSTPPFILCRINLAISDFQSDHGTSTQRALRDFFEAHSKPESSKPSVDSKDIAKKSIANSLDLQAVAGQLHDQSVTETLTGLENRLPINELDPDDAIEVVSIHSPEAASSGKPEVLRNGADNVIIDLSIDDDASLPQVKRSFPLYSSNSGHRDRKANKRAKITSYFSKSSS